MDLFCVGAAKTGTTSLFNILAACSEISVPTIKEPHYFGEYVGPGIGRKLSENEYLSLFEERDSKIRMDFSTSYLYSTCAASQIYKFNPQAKIVICLREHADRMLSLYNHQRRSLLEPCESIFAALEEESTRMENGYGYGFHYLNSTIYYDQIKRYIDIFPADNIRILNFSSIHNTEYVVETLSDFLGVKLNQEHIAKSARHANATGLPRSIKIQKLLVRDFKGKKFLKRILPSGFIKAIGNINIGSKYRYERDLPLHVSEMFKADKENISRLLGYDFKF